MSQTFWITFITGILRQRGGKAVCWLCAHSERGRKDSSGVAALVFNAAASLLSWYATTLQTPVITASRLGLLFLFAMAAPSCGSDGHDFSP
jgi:hypothetical protein